MVKRLEDLKGIGKETAKRLISSGIDTIEKLANMTPEDLIKLKIKGIGKATAIKYIETSKKTVEENKEIQNSTVKAPARKIPAKKAHTKKTPAKKAPTKKTPAKKAPAKKIPAKKAPAKKIPAKKIPAKKAPAKKIPAKKGYNIKELIKQQAECNIGLVGHVDHGM